MNGKVNFPLCLAPMVGLSHVALRRIVREYTPAARLTIWPTEMLNSRRLPGESLGQSPEITWDRSEEGLVPQILGNEEKPIADSVRKLVDWGAAGIDINMGCPVQKALKHNYGVALMGDANYAAEVVAMAVRNSSVPVSVKLRAGSQPGVKASEGDPDLFHQFVNGLVDAGASWICLHPRTAEQKRRGSADWSQIRSLVDSCKVPIVGNGDIQTADDVFQMLGETRCDLVMSGRALAARPWMMWQVAERMGMSAPEGFSGRAPSTPEEEGQEYGRVLQKFISYSRESFREDLALRKLRFWVKTTSVWLPFGHALWALMTKAQNLDQASKFAGEFFEREVTMSARTQLRE